MAAKTKKPTNFLREDVARMIAEDLDVMPHMLDNLADAIIVVVRERVLREIQSYARQNIR